MVKNFFIQLYIFFFKAHLTSEFEYQMEKRRGKLEWEQRALQHQSSAGKNCIEVHAPRKLCLFRVNQFQLERLNLFAWVFLVIWKGGNTQCHILAGHANVLWVPLYCLVTIEELHLCFLLSLTGRVNVWKSCLDNGNSKCQHLDISLVPKSRSWGV